MIEALLVGKQILLIYLYIIIGILCVKRKIVSFESGKSFSSFVLTVITPSLMIKAYMRPLEKNHLLGLGLAFFLAVLFHIMAISVTTLLIKKREDTRYKIERMGAVYSNCGFMAIPLIAVAAGDIGLFYAVAFISIFNIMLWTNGIMQITDQKKINLKSALLNPGVIGFAIGFSIYCIQMPIPDILDQGITSLSVLNTPLAMITTGIFLAEIDFKTTFNNWYIYHASLLRLVVLPFLMLLIIKILGVNQWISGADKVIIASILGCAAPAAASITLLPAKFGLEGAYGAKIIGVSTLCSIITLPSFCLIMQMWLGA